MTEPKQQPKNPAPANDPNEPNPGDPGAPIPTRRLSQPNFEELPRTSETPIGV